MSSRLRRLVRANLLLATGIDRPRALSENLLRSVESGLSQEKPNDLLPLPHLTFPSCWIGKQYFICSNQWLIFVIIFIALRKCTCSESIRKELFNDEILMSSFMRY